MGVDGYHRALRFPISRGSEWEWGEGPSPQSSPVEGQRRGSHPHLNPLPSRERRGKAGVVCRRRAGEGGFQNPLSYGNKEGNEVWGEGPSPQSSPVEGEEGESPSPQSSPVDGEEEGRRAFRNGIRVNGGLE